MKLCTLSILTALAALTASPAAAQKVVKESIRSQGKGRAYYLYVPDTVSPDAPAPLLVLLHGSGRNGLSLVERWTNLAKKEGIILAGPDALDSQLWMIPDDGPAFIHELVEALKAAYPINPQRVYLFGHSAGAGQALYLSLLESEYFAATAVHAGALRADDDAFLERARRRIPIALFVGTNDHSLPVSVVRATRETLIGRGFKPELTEISGHTHSYYDRSADINERVWRFLRQHALDGEPKYEQHQFGP